MTLQSIHIPNEIKQLGHSAAAARLIDLANDRIEAFLLADDSVIEEFIPCDFHLLDQALTWIEQNDLLEGNRFCELGSGFGVAALLAALRGMQSVGIEIEPALVAQARHLADALDLPAKFYCGSFVPRDISGILELAYAGKQFQTDDRQVYEEIGLGLSDFDLFFVFPWPGEQPFLEALFEARASKNSLLLSFHGHNRMQLVGKT